MECHTRSDVCSWHQLGPFIQKESGLPRQAVEGRGKVRCVEEPVVGSRSGGIELQGGPPVIGSKWQLQRREKGGTRAKCLAQNAHVFPRVQLVPNPRQSVEPVVDWEATTVGVDGGEQRGRA